MRLSTRSARALALTAHQEKERDECASGGGFFIAQMHLFSGGERTESDWAWANKGTPVIKPRNK